MMNVEIKKVVNRVKTAQSQLQSLLKDQTWLDDARKYAERQGREVKKLFAADVTKVKNFLGRERKELARFQKQIPSEVQKLRKFVTKQKKEFERMLLSVRKAKTKVKVSPPVRKKGTATKVKTTPASAETTTPNA